MAGGASTSIVINIDTKQATNNIDNLEQRFAKLQETVSKLGAEQYLTNEYNELIKMSEILKKSAETAKTTFDKITLFTDMRSFLSSVENFNKKIDETGAKVDKISNISFKVDNIEFTSKSVIENQLKKLQDICDKESKKIKLNIGVENFAKTNVKNIVKEYKKNLETEIKKNIESGDFRATVPLMYKYKVISQGYNTNNMNFNDIDTKREAAISKLTSPDLKRFGLTEDQTNQIKSEWNKNSQDLLATIENISNELTTKAQNIKITSGKNGINIVDNKSLNDTETQINELKQTISKAYDELLDVFNDKNKEARTKTYDLSRLIVEKLNQLKVLDPKAINLENITEAYDRQINTEAILKKANIMISEPDLSEYEDTEDKINQYNDLLVLLEDLKTAKGALSDKSFSKILSDNNINVTDINNRFKILHEGFVQTNIDFNKLSGSATKFQTLIGEVFGNKYILPEFKGTGTGSGSGSGSGTGNGSGDSDFDNAEVEKLQQDYADLTAEVEKYKAQIAETTAKLEEMKKTQAESEGDKSKIKELQASLDALNVSYAEAQNKMKEYRSELAAYESMSLVQDANGNNVNQEQYDKLISDAKQTATELENTRNQLKMLQEQAAAGGSDEYVVQLNNQLKSTEAMLNKVTNELEYMESSRNRWMDRAEMNAVIDESGQSVYQNDYDNIVAKLSEMKTEAQNAKDELEKLKATSVQLGEGEQVAKTSDLETVKGLSEAVKNLQERMTKAEEILKEVPQGMDGLKKLSSQIQKMSGNFNEDGSIKNMGVSAEALSEQLKNLDAEFDARIAKKIEELEKKSYKENQHKKKFKLAESVKSLKVVAAQTAPKVEVQQVNNDIKSAQQDATVKAEEITKELYKETEEYKALSKAVQEYNALTSQKLDATAYDARIERMQKMQAIVASIIETVEKYEGKASELSELTLKSKNGNIGIQDTVKLDELMSKLKAGEAKNVSKKEQTEQLKQDAQKYVDVVRDYNNKFQSIISQKVSSGKQFNSMKQQLNDLSNSIDTIMDKYDQFKGQDFYSADFASYGEELRGRVKDSSLDLNEIAKFKRYEQEVLSIQLKYSESLQKQKKEQDAVAEAARKKAEAEKEAVKAAEEAENKMSVAEKSREEQKRKVLERQAAQSGTRTSNINSAPPDNTTLGAILTEVKSINGKMDKPVETNVDNNTGILSDDERYQLEAYKKMSKAEQAYDLEVGYRDVGLTQLIKAKISAFSGSFEQLIEELQDTLVNRIGAITEDIQDPNFKYEEFDGRAIENVQQLAEFIQFLNSLKITDAQDTTFDSKAIDNILAEIKAISQKMDTSTTKASNNASPNISANQSPNNTPSSVTTPSISSEVQAASKAATAEVQAFTTIDDAVTGLTGDINTKTEAIRAEATEMTNAAKSEVASISQIKQAVSDLATQIHNVPKVRIVGENDGKLNISANLTEEQIAVIREKLKAAFSGEQAIPISFVPNVEGLKQQIADALKNVPVEITNNNINRVIKVNKFKANSDGVEALRNSISSQLKNVKIQSFDATTAAESVKETLSKVLDGVGLKFDTEKLGNEVREAVNSGVEAASAEQKPETSDNKAVKFKEKATNDIGKLRDKYSDKLQGQQLEVFKERLNEIDNKIKEIKDDASNYTDENAQVIDKDIKQIESLVNSFKEINNSEDKINSLIQKLKDSKNNIERRGAAAQPVVNNINSEMSALEELKRSGQNLNVGNPAEVQAFIDKLHEADATVESLQQSAKDIRVSTNATASVAKLDSKFNDLLFKVDKFRRDNSKITSDKGISAQFDSLMRSIQTIEKSDVNFQRLRAQFDQLKATVQGKGLTGRSLGDELKYIAEKIGIKAMLGNSIYRVIGAFRQMVGIVTELDTGMTTLRRVTEETEATYRKFLKTAGDEAHELGSTVSGLVDSTGDFARLGYNIQEANALAKNAVMYSNVGWLDIQTATADMTSTMKAFNIEASDSIRIVDTFDILGKKLPLVTISVKGWRHSRPSKDIVNHNICVTTAGGVW